MKFPQLIMYWCKYIQFKCECLVNIAKPNVDPRGSLMLWERRIRQRSASVAVCERTRGACQVATSHGSKQLKL